MIIINLKTHRNKARTIFPQILIYLKQLHRQGYQIPIHVIFHFQISEKGTTPMMSTAGVEQLNPDSVSITVMETVNGSHEFTIKGFSLAKGMSPGKFIQSDVFSVGGYDWAIYFYPDGKNPEDNSVYVSLFIALASDSSDVRALFELTLMDQSGKGHHKVQSHFDRALEGGPYTLKYKGSMW